MTKKDWDKVEISSVKEYIISYQISRDKFHGKFPALYVDVNIPKYSMKFLDWIQVGVDETERKYHYRRIKEIKEIDEKKS
jgi:hypothetical protein